MPSFLRRLPKTELHLHLDGSLPFEFIRARAVARGIDLPAVAMAEGGEGEQALRNYLHGMKARARRKDSLNAQPAGGNWGVFDWCNQFLMTKEELSDAAAMICEHAAAQHNVLRTELRFCPVLHTQEGLTPRDAVDAVVEGVESASAGKNGVIICALRSHSATHSMEMAQLAVDAKLQTDGVVCGFDIAGDEGSFPLSMHREAVEFCKAHNLPVTVHAGEWPGSQHNISLALELGVDRIGHGWGMAASPDIMEACRKQGVVVEVCLTSNVKPGAGSEWIESYEQHPVRKMVNAGVKVCLNSDNHLLSGAADRRATPTGEIQHLMSSCDFTIDEVIQLLRNGVNASFVPNPGDQADLMARFEAELQNALH